MKGVILAAGKGSRLYPVTHIIPKPLLPLANRPTLYYAFDRLKEIGITEICIVVGENENYMKEALGDGSALGISLSYVRQTDPHGLAHAVGFAKDFVDGDSFVLYLGDAIYDAPLTKIAATYAAGGAANVNLVKAVEDPHRFGVANTEGDRIVKLVEKPKNPESNLAMAGVYFFGPQLWEVLPDLQPSARGEYEITDAIQLLINQGETVLASQYDGVWFDSGTLDSFLEVSTFLTKGTNLVAGQLNGKIGDNVVIGEGAVVECDSITDSVVLPGAKVTVYGSISRAILGGEVKSDDDLADVILHGDYKG